jgi:malate dehydrogenase (oxaloacetate-decarboxylating)
VGQLLWVPAAVRLSKPNQQLARVSGVFRGALDNRVTKITDEMKLKAAHNLAALVKRPVADRVIPGPFDKGVAQAVAKAIR